MIVFIDFLNGINYNEIPSFEQNTTFEPCSTAIDIKKITWDK